MDYDDEEIDDDEDYDEDEDGREATGADPNSADRALSFPAFPPGKRYGKKFADTWWGNAWIESMEETALDRDQLVKGRRYAQAGHVGPVTVGPGRISAPVHDGDHHAPHATLVRLPALPDHGWERFLDKVAAKAGHIAALLDREMPRELVAAADDAGVRLLPSYGDLEPECDCPGWDIPCQHAAALSYQVAWLLDRDPFVLLLMRGRAEAELIEELQRRNSRRPDELGTAARSAGTPAVEAYAAPPRPLPARSRPVPGPPQQLAGLLAQAQAPGIDPDALSVLAADAAERARALLGTAPDSPPPPELTPWQDAARLAAGRLPPALTERLSQACERPADFPRAVRAWALGGVNGLAAMDLVWSPPKVVVARASTEIDDAWQDTGLGERPELTVWRNRWTVVGRGVQLRYGEDGRWYPFREKAGEWWPDGPPGGDLSVILAELLPE
jgi:uncharacterized Zn finger protein